MGQVEELTDKIKKYSHAFHEGEPKISEDAFDLLVEQLRLLDPENEFLNTVGWGYEIRCPERKVPLKYPVGDTSTTVTDVKRVSITPGDSIALPIVDGETVFIYYSNGLMEYAAIYEDGEYGLDVTKKLEYLVPNTLEHSPDFTGYVRGRVSVGYDKFCGKYSDRYDSAGEFVSDILSSESVTSDQVGDLDFLAYTVRGNTGYMTENSVLRWISTNGFKQADTLIPKSTDRWELSDLEHFIREYGRFPVVGITITSIFFDEDDDGFWCPVDEVFIERPARGAFVTVDTVEWRLSHTGRVDPVVTFNPTELSGSTITDATAFNAGFVKETHLGIGSEVIIDCNGDAHPYVQSVVSSMENPAIPEKCPECGSPLVTKGPNLICDNPECYGKTSMDLVYWLDEIAHVNGFRTAMRKAVLEHFDIHSVDRLYEVIDDICPYIEKNVGRLNWKVKTRQFVEKLKSPVSFQQFISSLRLPGISNMNVWRLDDRYDLIMSEDSELPIWGIQVRGIEGLEMESKNALVKSIGKIRRYASYLDVVKPKKGMRLAISGEISVSHKDFYREMARYGVTEADVSRADYLVAEDLDGVKKKDMVARDRRIPVVLESEFRRIVENEGGRAF